MMYSTNHCIRFCESMCIPPTMLGKGPVKYILRLVDRQRHYKHVPAAVNRCNKIISRTFPNERLVQDSGRTLVCAEYGYPKESPNTNN
jgi:hypothetical protein